MMYHGILFSSIYLLARHCWILQYIDIAIQRGHHTVSDVTGRDAAVSIVMSVQTLRGSIKSTHFLHYLRNQCGTSDVTSHLLSDRPAALAELTSCQQHGIT